MNTLEVGNKLCALCREFKFTEAMESLYDKDIVSVEAAEMPGMPREVKGLAAVREKAKRWEEANTIHSAATEGPYPNGDRFAVRFTLDVSNKPTGERRKLDEIALYTVKNGKIVREDFFYAM